MVQTCSAYGCKNRYDKDRDISFHKFPLARPIICGKWVAALRRNNFKPTKYSNICSQHFTKDCFKSECNNRVLKDNAVPSLFTFNLNIKSEPLDHHFSSEIHFPDLCLPLTPGLAEDDLEEEEACSNLIDIQNDTVVVSCDHNYTADETNRNWEAEREWTQQKRIRHLEGQVRSLRKKLKTMQQKCRRQDRKLKRMKAAITISTLFEENCNWIQPTELIRRVLVRYAPHEDLQYSLQQLDRKILEKQEQREINKHIRGWLL